MTMKAFQFLITLLVIAAAKACTSNSLQHRSLNGIEKHHPPSPSPEKDCLIQNTTRDFTPLCIATAKGNLEMVKLLVKFGANMHASCNKMRPVHIAAAYGHVNVLQFLLENGQNINEPAQDTKCTPLHFAARNIQLKVVKYMLTKDVNANAKNVNGDTALDLAVLNMQTDPAGMNNTIPNA